MQPVRICNSHSLLSSERPNSGHGPVVKRIKDTHESTF